VCQQSSRLRAYLPLAAALDFTGAYDKLENRTQLEVSSTMTAIIALIKKYKAELVLIGLYTYVIILGFATLKEFGII
jgi:hypothetical protein